MACGFLRFMNRHDYGAEKGRLRSRQIIGAIRIQNGAIVFDLEEEILDHSFGKFRPAIPQKSDQDEITIPTVLFIEASTRYHVAILEIEKPGLGQLGGI